jgi:peptidoglycan/xylan/chitin deacetylase (PgdA/CDA1 family)
MLRTAIKAAGAWALHATGCDRMVASSRGLEHEPLVLCYHRVVHDLRRHTWSAPAMLITKRTLAAQLAWVGRRYRFVGLDELTDAIASGAAARERRPLAAVTFDDGYADVYRNALPVLARESIPATVFVVTDLVGTPALQLHDRLHALLRQANRRFGASGLVSLCDRHHLEPPRWRADLGWSQAQVTRLGEMLLATQPRAVLDRLVDDLERYVAVPFEVAEALHALDWRMLRELQQAGVTVGSHTRSHRVLPNENADDVLEELAGSKRALEGELGTPVRHFSFPNGHFTRATLRAVRAAGYQYAYSTCSHRDPEHPALTVPRRTLWERSLAGVGSRVSTAVASCLVRGVFDWRTVCPHDHATPSPGPAVRRRAGREESKPPQGQPPNPPPVGEPLRS